MRRWHNRGSLHYICIYVTEFIPQSKNSRNLATTRQPSCKWASDMNGQFTGEGTYMTDKHVRHHQPLETWRSKPPWGAREGALAANSPFLLLQKTWFSSRHSHWEAPKVCDTSPPRSNACSGLHEHPYIHGAHSQTQNQSLKKLPRWDSIFLL